MNKIFKAGAIVLLVAAGLGIGGCVYYPVRTGVAYSDPADGNAAVDYNDSGTYYAAPAYGYGYYDPYGYGYGPGWYGYGWPAVSLGFYGGYWGGGHYHGPWRGRGGWAGHYGGGMRNAVPMSRGAHH
jgi:hypothetical protein